MGGSVAAAGGRYSISTRRSRRVWIASTAKGARNLALYPSSTKSRLAATRRIVAGARGAKKKRPGGRFFSISRASLLRMLLSQSKLLADTRRLAGALAQVVELGASY